MTKRSEQIYDELFLEHSDEDLIVEINKDLFEELKVSKAAITKYMKKWEMENQARWLGSDKIQLIINEGKDEFIESD